MDLMEKPLNLNLPDKLCKLLFFINEADKIDSKTKFQKMIFLLQEEYGLDLGFQFIKYNYGPYSFDLTDGLEVLKTLKLIEEQTIISEPQNSQFPFKQIVYKISDMGKKIAEKLSKDIPQLDKEKIKKVLNDWNNKSREEIVHYVYERHSG